MGESHINEEMIEKLLTGCATNEEKIRILTHASSCECCSERLLLLNEKENPMAMPQNLKESILTGTQRTIPKSPKKQFWFYSAKVCAAVCAALVVLFVVPLGGKTAREMAQQNVQTQMKPRESLTQKLGGAVDRLTWQLYTGVKR